MNVEELERAARLCIADALATDSRLSYAECRLVAAYALLALRSPEADAALFRAVTAVGFLELSVAVDFLHQPCPAPAPAAINRTLAAAVSGLTTSAVRPAVRRLVQLGYLVPSSTHTPAGVPGYFVAHHFRMESGQARPVPKTRRHGAQVGGN